MFKKGKDVTRARNFLCVGLFGLALGASVHAEPVNVSSLSSDLLYVSLPDGGVLSSLSGNIQIGDVRKNLCIKTVSGDIRLGYVGSALSVSSISGNVSVRDGKDDLKINAVSGDIHVVRASGNLNVTSVSGSVDIGLVSTNATPRTSEVHTTSGNITLHLPKTFSGRIDLWTNESESRKRSPIVQFLGLKFERGEWKSRDAGVFCVGNRLRQVHASGRIGAGDDQVALYSMTGTINLVQD